MAREYCIEDCGEDWQVALLENGVHVGSVIFDDDGHGGGFDLAYNMAEAWRNSSREATTIERSRVLH